MKLSRYHLSQTTTHMHGHHGATMGLAGVSLGPRAQSSSSEPHRIGAAWHRLRTRSQTRVQTAPSHNKWNARLQHGHQPLREVRVGIAVPGLAHHVGAEW